MDASMYEALRMCQRRSSYFARKPLRGLLRSALGARSDKLENLRKDAIFQHFPERRTGRSLDELADEEGHVVVHQVSRPCVGAKGGEQTRRDFFGAAVERRLDASGPELHSLGVR